MDLESLRRAAYLDGAWFGAELGERIAVVDPFTGAGIADLPNLGRVHAEQAIAAAALALPAWRATPAGHRAQILRRMAALARTHVEALAALLTAEQGKPLAEARGEIAYAAGYLDWYAEQARRVQGHTLPAARADQRIVVQREPVGVCAAITPWNFPSAMLARKLAPALAAGCTMVCKPSEQTPLSGLAWAAIGQEAGLPAGVLSILTGDPEPIATAFMESPAVRKLSFTGSTAVGKLLITQSATTVTRLSLELGGNAPFIVFEDADLQDVLAGAMASKFRASGQTCVCANRFLVQDSIVDELSALLVESSSALVVGDGRDPAVQLGPLINERAVRKVARLVDDAVAKGAQLALGSAPEPSSLLCRPVVLTGVDNAMAVAQEEIFGPVVAIQSFSDEAEAIALANASDAGLAAYLYTADARRIDRVLEALEYGMVGVNETMLSDPAAPFGGIKESGYGREGGAEGIEEYLRLKYVVTRVS